MVKSLGIRPITKHTNIPQNHLGLATFQYFLRVFSRLGFLLTTKAKRDMGIILRRIHVSCGSFLCWHIFLGWVLLSAESDLDLGDRALSRTFHKGKLISLAHIRSL